MPLKNKLALLFLAVSASVYFYDNGITRSIASNESSRLSLKQFFLQRDSEFIQKKTFKAGKTKGHFNVEITSYKVDDEKTIYQAQIVFNENSDLIFWRLHDFSGLGLDIESSTQGKFDRINAGESKTLQFTLSNKEFDASHVFLEVYKVVNNKKLGALTILKPQVLAPITSIENKPLTEGNGPRIFQ